MRDETPARSPALAAIEPLDDADCRLLLGRHRLCTLSLVDGDVPYAVPLFYGFDGQTLYLGLAEGRKTDVLDANSHVCLTIVETGIGDGWMSVQVTGTADFLSGEEREQGVRVLIEHNTRVKPAVSSAGAAGSARSDHSAAGARPHRGGRILRVRDALLSGRIRP